jgi:uncharacterized membrane protein YesL
MFSFEGFVRIDTFLRAIYRVAYLNLLWVATTVLGLGVLGFGPASYAFAAYVDRWFRHGETPPPARAFLAAVRERTWQSMVVGWILLGAGTVILTNVFVAPSWLVRALNVLALVVLGIAAAYVFPVMAATDVRTVPRQFAAALLVGVGSLHWTILGATAVGLAEWLLWQYASPLLLFFGAGIPAVAVGLITRIVFRPLVAAPEPPAGTTVLHPRIAPVTERAS